VQLVEGAVEVAHAGVVVAEARHHQLHRRRRRRARGEGIEGGLVGEAADGVVVEVTLAFPLAFAFAFTLPFAFARHPTTAAAASTQQQRDDDDANEAGQSGGTAHHDAVLGREEVRHSDIGWILRRQLHRRCQFGLAGHLATTRA
jgi:hypothetical protein